MELLVKLFATYRDGRFDARKIEYAPGTTVGAILEGLELPTSELGIALVNGRHVELDHRPVAGDTVSLFPKVGGG